jgi:2-polyprenyl-3-methyl-5-hydroxy-6-metoxy-1,4-benzoquinol methylase
MSSKRNHEVKDIWNANAAFWDKRMGEGNDFHKMLIEPNQLELLDIKKGDVILDVACGNGQFARKMTELGAKVTAIDFSDEFIKIAKAKPLADKIDYKVIDVIDINDLNQLQRCRFDSIVSTAALMDVENIEALAGFLPRVLKNNGKFVFSILHPCFNSGENTLLHERNDFGGKINETYGVKISNYLISRKVKGIGMVGQPVPQYYFHRPLSEILKVFFKNGFILNDLREPSFKDAEIKSIYNNVFINIPPVIIFGFKLIK